MEACFSPRFFNVFRNGFYKVRIKSQSTWHLNKQYYKYKVCKDHITFKRKNRQKTQNSQKDEKPIFHINR